MNRSGLRPAVFFGFWLAASNIYAENARRPAPLRGGLDMARQLGFSEPFTPAVMPLSEGRRAFAKGVSLSGGDAENLYLRGAEVMEVYGPKDRYSRVISLKLHTVKDMASFNEMLRIYDVTDVTMGKPDPDIFSQEFATWNPLDTTFQLDDRVPGKKEYVLRISFPDHPDADISFGRPGNESQLRTTLRRLLHLRAKQVLDEGKMVEINNRAFFSYPQCGGGICSLMYFPEDLADRLNDEHIEALSPRLLADLSDRNGRYSGPQPLGWVEDKYYYLVYDQENGYWVPTAGNPP